MGSAQRHGNDNSATQGQIAAFGDLDIGVVVRRDDPGDLLVRELQKTRAGVRHIWPIPDQIPVDFDVVFCELCSDLPRRLPWLPGSPSTALVLVVRAGTAVDLNTLNNCAPNAVVHLPVVKDAAVTALALGRNHFLYERRLRGRIEKLDDNLRMMRSVERAKAILIETKNLSEQEAYHFLRSRAMERSLSIGAIAAMIVDSHELLG